MFIVCNECINEYDYIFEIEENGKMQIKSDELFL